MKLFSKIISKQEYIAGIVLKEEEGAIFYLAVSSDTGKCEKIDSERFKYTNSWERLVQDIDEALFKLENRNNSKVVKSIFFLYSHLVEIKNNNVKDQYLRKLKEVIAENQLTPLGFIEHHQAISAYLAEKEQAPLTAILVEIDKPEVSVFVYKGGELKFVTQVAKTQALASDIAEAFSQIPKETILPSRLILYNSSDLEQESTQILNYRFPEEQFIQLPKVEVLTAEEIDTALIKAFETEFSSEGQNAKIAQFTADVATTPTLNDSEDNLGFVIGEDLRESAVPPQEQSVVTDKTEDDYIGNDAEEEVERAESPAVDTEKLSSNESSTDSILEQDYPKSLDTDMPDKFNLKKLNSYFVWLLAHFKKRMTFLFGLGAIIAVFVGALFFFHKATLTIFFESTPVEEELVLTNEPKITAVEADLSDKVTVATTGTDEIGESSAGEVTIYNAQTSEKTFPKGTTLTAQGKEYLLNEEVKVASASTQLTSGGDLLTVTGKKKTKITASQIGPEYNLDKDTKMVIDAAPVNNYYAMTETAISGGTKKKVRTVSETDLEKAIAAVEKKIKEKSIESEESDKERKTIAQLASLDTQKETYSAEVGEEAQSLTVEIAATVASFAYSEEEMKQLLVEKLKETVPEGYTIRPQDINYKIVSATNEDETVLTLEVRAKPIYSVDSSKVAMALRGKKEVKVGRILKDQFDAQGYELKIHSQLPFIKLMMPFFSRNIEIKTKSL